MRRRAMVRCGLIVLLVGVFWGTWSGCDDRDPVSSYCGRYNYCFGDELSICLDERRELEDQAIAVGQECYDAFLAFHECIADLSCADLDEYLADQSHCGARYNAWQNRCGGT